LHPIIIVLGIMILICSSCHWY